MTQRGSSFGAALSNVLANTLTQHHAATAGVNGELRANFITQLLESMETELADTLRPVLEPLAAGEDVSPQLQHIVTQATGPGHQADFFLQIAMWIGIAMGGMSLLAQPYLQQDVNRLWAKYPNARISPADAATAFIRGIMPEDMARTEARDSGIDDGRWTVLRDLSGEPPGPMDLLNLWRRDIITQDRMHHGIRQSRVRDEWLDVYDALRWVPLSPAEAAQAAVEGHLSYQEAEDIAKSSGLHPAGFAIMFEAMGSPPGVNDIGDLLNRGTWTMEQAQKAMRESRVKPKYETDVLSLREALPPREAIVLMVERGVIDKEAAVRKAMQLGYNRENATFLVQEALNRKLAKERDLTKSEITSLYATGFIDRPTAAGFVGQLGYDEHESAFILDLVDAGIERTARTSAQSRVHTLYVNFRIDRTEASSALDAIGVRTDVRDNLLRIWTHEREANTKDLTQAQLTAAFRADLIDRPTYLQRLAAIGYTAPDAALLAELAIPTES